MKEWGQLILCLLLSAGIWLIHNLSQSYVNIVSMPIMAESNMDGRARLSTSSATITAQVRASGFRQSRLSRKKKRTKLVSVSATDFRHEQEDIFFINTSDLYKYSSAIFGDGVTIESIISENPKFNFPEVSHKKVPVRKVLTLSFASQYMSEEGMQLQPDSVYVYGESSRLENINYMLTKPVELNNIRSSVHGKVKLEVPSGVRLSTDDVLYSMDVTRYVEIKAEVKIEVRNVPPGVELVVLPSTADVVFRSVFPPTADPTTTARFFIDYEDFVHSLTGKCVVKSEGIPSTVINYDLHPEVFDCVAKTSSEE